MNIRTTLMFTLLFITSATIASASSITYTFQGTGTGDLGGVSFVSTLFTITVEGDTGNVEYLGNGVFSNPALSSHIAIQGFQPASFITATRVFDAGVVNKHFVDTLGFSRAPNAADLLDLPNAAFLSYDLATSIGPIFVAEPNTYGFGCFSFGDCVVTTGGMLDFSSIIGVTFSAETTTPEPGTLVLVGAGCLVMTRSVRARRKHPPTTTTRGVA